MYHLAIINSVNSSQLPIVKLLAALIEIDEYNTKDTESVVTAIEALLIQASDKLAIDKSEILAQVIKSCLLSDDNNPNHINGIDLFKRCDNCFLNN